MHSLVHFPSFNESSGVHAESDVATVLSNSRPFFRTIPPERIGLNGEYDHSGLAKRVEQTFRKHFQLNQLEKLSITQRGRVVILRGELPDRQFLNQLVSIVLEIPGATYVETQAVKFVK